MNNKIKSIQKNRIDFLIFLFYALLSFPNYNTTIGSGLDQSWIFFLNFSTGLSSKFGKDYFFTYGPLGFLIAPENINSNLIIANIFWFVLYGLNLYLLINVLYESKQDKINIQFKILSVILYAIGIVLAGSADIYLCYVSLLIMSLVWLGNKKMVILLDALIVVCFFIKFSTFFMLAFSAIIFSFAYWFIRKDWKTLVWLSMSVPIIVICYLIYNPSIMDGIRYVKSAIEISMGYNYAMSSSSEGHDEYVLWVLLDLIAFIVIAISLIRKKRIDYVGLFLALCASLFFFYKEGFVRHGGGIFFAGIALVFSIIFFTFNWKDVLLADKLYFDKIDKGILISLFTIFLICIIYSGTILPNIFQSIKNKVLDYPVGLTTALLDRGNNASTVDNELRNIIGDSTVTVFPWELSYAYDNKINFKFMPTLQNYTAYTNWLDRQNAIFFSSNESAPEYIIFTTDTIDGRIPLIETPLTWNAIKNNYTVETQINNKYLLKKKAILSSYLFAGEFLETNTINYNYENNFTKYFNKLLNIESRNPIKEPYLKNINLIKCKNGANYISLNAHLNWKGKLAKIFWKIPAVQMEVTFDDETSVSGRILFEMLTEPFSVNEIGQTSNIDTLITSGSSKRAVSIKFSGRGMKYYDNIDINWYKD